MNRHTRILAGTALGLLMASAPVGLAQALEAPHPQLPAQAKASGSILLVQAEPATDEEKQEREKKRAERAAKKAEKAAEKAEKAAEEAKEEAEKQPPAEAPAAAPAEAPAADAPTAEQPAAEEPPAAPAEAPAAAPAEAPAAAEPAAEEPAAEEPATEQPAAEEPAAAPAEAPAAEEPAANEPAAEEPAAAPAEAPAAEEPAAGQPAGGTDQPMPRGEAQPAQGEQPAADQPAADQPAAEQPAAEEPAPAEAPAAAPAEQPAADQPAPDQPAADQPAADQPAGEGAQDGTQDGAKAPVLDSQKQPAGQPAGGMDQPMPTGEQQPAQGEQPQQPAEAAPPPSDDRAAQEEARPQEIVPVTQEEGRRIDAEPDTRRAARPEGAEVLREIGDRVVIQFNNQVIVESNDRPRLARGAREVYYEELPRGRTREVIVRKNGVQVITIRNRYGDVIRRSRIAPDGREYVLVYVEDAYYDQVRDWRDPGLDLPPLRLTIPVDEYILEAEEARGPDTYYTFFEQPPVERVERLYSIDEVKRSARIRDKVRRVDLDTITFEFGSAAIPETEIQKLEGVAQAIERVLQDNPAETFLIEGHTDAVGTDIANLALSDRRAEAVADALTNVFAIPPENLATQGYGEQYLKVNTEEPARENRRVAIRRITPLVAPVASAQ